MGAVVGNPTPTTGGGSRYTHVQATPSASWNIPHGLGGKYPVAIFLSTAPTQPVIPDLEYPDNDTIVAAFDSAVTGRADI